MTRHRSWRLVGPVFIVVLGSWILTGCTNSGQANQAFSSADRPPDILDTSGRQAVFTAADGKELGYIRYTAPARSADVALVYLHGIESHAGWFKMASEGLAERGYDVYCLDRRGSGINRENRNFPSGHIDSYETLLSDIHTFIEPLHDRYGAVVLVGLSWGGKLAMAHVLRYPGDAAGVVMITPGLRAHVDKSALSKVGILSASVFAPKTAFKTPIEPEMFTTKQPYLNIIREDGLRLRYVSARFLMQSRALDKYIDRHMADNGLPLQLFLAGRDRIIDNAGVKAVLARGGQEVLDEVLYEDQTHSMQFEAPDRLVADIDRWITERVVARPSPEPKP